MEQETKQLFIAYITGNCSPAQVESVLSKMRQGGYEEEWIAAMEVAEEMLNSQEKAGNFKTKLPLDKSHLLHKIRKEAGIHSSRTIKWPIAITSAAAAILLVATLIFYNGSFNKKELPQQITQTVEQPAKNVKDTQRRWLKLPDGTTVVLNAGSKLDYPDSFDGVSIREVSLSGEGFFDVAHNASKPFIIHTGKLKTTVLGTAFNIRAYPNSDSITVTVTRGKVMVQEANKTLAILTPAQQLEWVKQYPATINEKVNLPEVLAWKADDLIMDDLTLEEAALLITKRYHLKVAFMNERIKNCRFTAAFLNRNDLTQVLSVLGDITGTTTNIKDNIIYIDGPGCESL